MGPKQLAEHDQHMKSTDENDLLRRSAERVADCLAESGQAFLEDGDLDGLTTVLRAFLATANVRRLEDPDPGIVEGRRV